MKTNTLLLVASLAVLATIANAAESRIETNTVVLPTYVIEAPRYLPIERQINASLNELRQQAHAPIAIVPGLSDLKAQIDRGTGHALSAQSVKSVRVAKL